MDIFYGILGALGTFIAVYQAAVLRESRKRKEELQYLLISIGQVAILKHQAWEDLIELLDDGDTREVRKSYMKASNDMKEINSMASTLESVIDSQGSAASKMQERILRDITAQQTAGVQKG